MLTMLLFFSCKKDKFEAVTAIELSPFIDDFINEGEKRGIILSKDKLEAFLVTELDYENISDNTCGLGWADFNNQRTQRIEILKSENCWESRSNIQKENLIFHELGHSLLDRGHLNTTFSSLGGVSNSMMCSGTDGYCSNFNVYYEDGAFKDYYLDELFGVNTGTPDFVQQTNVVRTLFEDQFTTDSLGWLVFSDNEDLFEAKIDSFENKLTTAPYSLEVAIKPIEGDTNAVDLLLVKRFELTDFKDCSNLVFKADVRTEGEIDGFIATALSLRERLPDGSLNRFYLISRKQEMFNNSTDFFENFELEMYCVSARANVVSASFQIQSKLPAKVYIDNIRVELVE